MRVLISGGTGYVGSHLLPLLEESGHAVAILVRKSTPVAHPKTAIIHSDISSLAAFCVDWRPDAVVHLAADVTKGAEISQIDGLAAANIVLPLHMAAAANASGAKWFINVTTFSTSSDTMDYHPQTLYAATKRACEDLLTYYHQSEAIKICNLVFYDVYGPRQPHARFLNDVISAVMDGTSLSMSKGEQDICFLHVLDAVNAILYCLRERDSLSALSNNTFCVCGPEVFRLRTVPERVAKILNRPYPAVQYDRPYRKNEIMRFSPRHELLSGWKPHFDFEAGIKSITLLRC